MVVFVMSKQDPTKGHAMMRSRHVEVVFPTKENTALEMSSSRTPTAPTSRLASVNRSGIRFAKSSPPLSLIPDEWMHTLVHYVAELKRAMYDSARQELSDAIMADIPLQLKQRLKGNTSDLLTVEMMYGGQISESVATHKSLTHTMSMRRLERPGSAASSRGFMDVSAHYMSFDSPSCDGGEHLGRLDALRGNATMQQIKSLVSRERAERHAIDSSFWLLRRHIGESLEDEERAALLMEQHKLWNRILSAEVGEFLQCKKREQVNARLVVQHQATALLKSEKDALLDYVLASGRAETQAVAQERVCQQQAVDAMLSELPMEPSNSSVDAEVARLLLKERRKKKEDLFPDIL